MFLVVVGKEKTALPFNKPKKKPDSKWRDVRRSLGRAKSAVEARRLYDLLLDGDVADERDHLAYAARALWYFDTASAWTVLEVVVHYDPRCARAWRLLRWLACKTSDSILRAQCDAALLRIKAGLLPVVLSRNAVS